tara:strand:+ start:979 stop:1146 length:168 start_codon:yes stop_codon:yes gene_type:complete
MDKKKIRIDYKYRGAASGFPTSRKSHLFFYLVLVVYRVQTPKLRQTMPMPFSTPT